MASCNRVRQKEVLGPHLALSTYNQIITLGHRRGFSGVLDNKPLPRPELSLWWVFVFTTEHHRPTAPFHHVRV